MRAELKGADAIAHLIARAWVPDSSLGVDPESKTWYRETLHVTAVKTFKGPLRDGDTLEVVDWYSRINREFDELEEKTQQFVFVPWMGNATVLLRRTRAGWEMTRALYPDDAFVAAYVRVAMLSDSAAAVALVRMLLDEYLDENRQHWGHIRVIQDDLDRMNVYGPKAELLWRREVGGRADELIRLAGRGGIDLFTQLAAYLPEPKRRECVRELLKSYDAAVDELRRLRHVDTNPPEMTGDLYRLMNASEAVSLLPGAMESLLPRGSGTAETLQPDNATPARLASIVTRARRYASPRREH